MVQEIASVKIPVQGSGVPGMPSGSYYLPVNLSNGQSSATGPNFQQMITFNPSSYSSYEASDLGNIRFYQGSSELYSWCESGCSSGASTARFWVDIPGGITASGTTTLDMVFEVPNSIEYDGVYAGEAPQLSAGYAQYDNGAKVFTTLYDNFAGNTINMTRYNDFTGPFEQSVNNPNYCIGAPCSTVIQNNGIIMNSTLYGGGSTFYGGLITTSGYTPPFIFDIYTKSRSQWDPAFSLQPTGSASYVTGFRDDHCIEAGDMAQLPTSGCITLSALLNAPAIDGGAWTGTTSQTWYENYTPVSTSYAITLPPVEYIGFGVFNGLNYVRGAVSFQWARIRSYPPAGTMPTVVLGAITNT